MGCGAGGARAPLSTARRSAAGGRRPRLGQIRAARSGYVPQTLNHPPHLPHTCRSPTLLPQPHNSNAFVAVSETAINSCGQVSGDATILRRRADRASGAATHPRSTATPRTPLSPCYITTLLCTPHKHCFIIAFPSKKHRRRWGDPPRRHRWVTASGGSDQP